MMARMMASVLLVACLLGTAFSGDWKDGVKPLKYSQMTFEEKHLNHKPMPVLPKDSMPKHFNWCELDGENWCTTSWNQHQPQYCGACWLHGTLSAVQDRLKILKGGKGQDVMLGRQTLLNCGAYDDFGAGCDGGDPIDVFHYLEKYGLPDETCLTYNATDHTKYLLPGEKLKPGEKKCPAHGKCVNCMPMRTEIPHWSIETCWPVKTPILYKVSSYGLINGVGEDAMMSEIYQRGPITCSCGTPREFTYEYRGGVYRGPNDTNIDHDVEVTGWGEDENGRYWVVRNSWGSYWGELGFFRLERGTNLLRMEEADCWYAVPTYDMEEQVLHGSLEGSMYGVLQSKKPSNNNADADAGAQARDSNDDDVETVRAAFRSRRANNPHVLRAQLNMGAASSRSR